MPMTIFVPLLFLSAAAGMQELDEATSSCAATTQAEPRRCLIQQQKASAAALQTAESRNPEATPTAQALEEAILADQAALDALEEWRTATVEYTRAQQMERLKEQRANAEAHRAELAAINETQQKVSAAALQTAESHALEAKPGALAELLASGEDSISSQDIADMLEHIMQEQPATAAQIPTTMLSEKKGYWTGQSVSVSFASTAPDMQNVQILSFNEYAAEDNKTLALASNTTKNYMEMSFPNTDGSQIVSNSILDKIYMYGFTAGTAGLKNSNANRVWYRHPSRKDAMLLYAFKMDEVPGDKEWKYSIEFTSSQPQALKVYPPGGKVAQKNNAIYVVMECPVPLECEDGKFTVSSVTFSPKSKEDQNAMKRPEDIVGKVGMVSPP